MARTISVPFDGRAAAARASKPLLALRGDDHLVDQVRRGNEVAFEVIYERHVPGILSFCRHMLGSREEGEDAVQHAFASAHRDLLRDDREIRLKPWLYAIARNRCLSMLRARREQPEDALDGSIDGLDDEVQRRADLRELVADLQDLPPDQRAALVLSELRDLSHADVAEALGCEVAKVKGLVFRARAGLIERREARDAACEEIQEELATARGGALRRGKLRHHVRACSACSNYLQQVRSQRRKMALILPVVPTLGLKEGVLAAVGIGGGASGGGGAAAGGLLAGALPATSATVAKVAVVGTLVGGAGVAGEAALDRDGPPASTPPGLTSDGAVNAPRSPLGGTDPSQASDQSVAARERRARARKEKRHKARGHGRAHAKANPAARAQKLPPKAGKVAKQPKRLRGFERPPKAVPVRARPPKPPRVRPKPPVPVKPLRKPKQKVVTEPTPPPARRTKPVP